MARLETLILYMACFATVVAAPLVLLRSLLVVSPVGIVGIVRVVSLGRRVVSGRLLFLSAVLLLVTLDSTPSALLVLPALCCPMAGSSTTLALRLLLRSWCFLGELGELESGGLLLQHLQQ